MVDFLFLAQKPNHRYPNILMVGWGRKVHKHYPKYYKRID